MKETQKETTQAWRLFVHGKVQGVGYRYFVMEEARRLNIVGWVRNIPEGGVEILAEGNPQSLSTFEERLRRGHPWAHVSEIEKRMETVMGHDKIFEIH